MNRFMFFSLMLAAQALPSSTPVVRSTAAAETTPAATSFMFRDTPIAELFEMIARRERINIVLGKGVTGNVARPEQLIQRQLGDVGVRHR